MNPRTGFVGDEGHHDYYLDGERVPSVTTITKLFPSPALEMWQQKQVATTAIEQWPRWEAMDDGEAERHILAVCRDAQREAMDRGSAVHALIEDFLRSRFYPIDVPDHLRGYFAAFDEFRRVWNPLFELVEVPVFRRSRSNYGLIAPGVPRCGAYAGTLDAIATLKHLGRTLCDWKTGRTYPSHTMQLAAYRYADFYITDNDGEERPIPAVDTCATVLLRADGAHEVVVLRANEEWFSSFACLRSLYDDHRATERNQATWREPGMVTPPYEKVTRPRVPANVAALTN